MGSATQSTQGKDRNALVAMAPEPLIQDLRPWVRDGEEGVPGSATRVVPLGPTTGAGECLRVGPASEESHGPSS